MTTGDGSAVTFERVERPPWLHILTLYPAVFVVLMIYFVPAMMRDPFFIRLLVPLAAIHVVLGPFGALPAGRVRVRQDAATLRVEGEHQSLLQRIFQGSKASGLAVSLDALRHARFVEKAKNPLRVACFGDWGLVEACSQTHTPALLGRGTTGVMLTHQDGARLFIRIQDAVALMEALKAGGVCCLPPAPNLDSAAFGEHSDADYVELHRRHHSKWWGLPLMGLPLLGLVWAWVVPPATSLHYGFLVALLAGAAALAYVGLTQWQVVTQIDAGRLRVSWIWPNPVHGEWTCSLSDMEWCPVTRWQPREAPAVGARTLRSLQTRSVSAGLRCGVLVRASEGEHFLTGSPHPDDLAGALEAQGVPRLPAAGALSEALRGA